MSAHFPFLWRFRILRAIHAKGSLANRQVLGAQARIEGGQAQWNPCNTTEPWPRSSLYNTAGVRNYRTQADGIAATAATFLNGNYPGIVRDFRAGTKTARAIVTDNAAEWDKWGTGAAKMLSVL
jgi:hypothetical protein